DLDGDRAADVVVTSACADGAVGTSEWRVKGASWALPPGFAARAFWGTSNDDCNAGPRYVLADLTGDLRPDLVVTSACDQSTLGTDHWDVYANTGAGFASTPISWPLPSFGARAFDHAHSDACGTAAPIFALEDLDGDHRPDLVVTSACDQSSLGTDHWNVYANTGSAFSAATSWSLPSYGARAFWTPSNDDCTQTTGPVYFVADLAGDERPELVVAFACDQSSLGTDHWDVYANSGAGFQTSAISWPLPAGFGGRAFIARGNDDCNAPPRYALVDLDGDRKLDLAITSTCGDDPVGTTWWLAARGTDTGFAAATEWCLPPGYGARAFAGAGSCPRYSLHDLDGDRAPELVVTSDCVSDDPSTTYWRMY
ncbi:MAG TPA: hypothetical protein VL463_17170, partial [Kofleriaceae bacterium]|nr:hypothetical protein [Kofleriaceae bacterium]